MRIGIGYDSHRFLAGRPLVLGGVRIEHSEGLDGHSDADVVSHAIVDAILGALALGDIGAYFPDTDLKWKGADSRVFLREAAARAGDEGYCIGNVDVTIVAEAPRLSRHTREIRESLAQALAIDISSVSIKATTAERMGALGRGEGIAATAVALMRRQEGD